MPTGGVSYVIRTIFTTLPQSKIGSEEPIFASSLRERAKGAFVFFKRCIN